MIDYSTVRNKWLEKFNQPSSDQKSVNERSSSDNLKRKSISVLDNSPKKLKSQNGAIEKFVKSEVKCPVCQKSIDKNKVNEHLDECLEDDQNKSDESFEELKDNIVKINCPVCSKSVNEADLNDHLDSCLKDDDNVFTGKSRHRNTRRSSAD